MKSWISFLLLLPLFFYCQRAEALYDQIGRLGEAEALEETLSEEERGLTGRLSLDGSYDTQAAVVRLWERFRETLSVSVRKELREAGSLFLIALACAFGNIFCESAELRTNLDRIGCCAAAIFVSGSVNGLLTTATDTLDRFSSYSHISLPVIFTTAAASGAVVSASARYAAACFALDVLLTVSQRWVLPLIYLYLGLAIGKSLAPNSLLQVGADVCKWAINSSLTAVTLAFGTYLSLTGLLTGSADAVAVKTTRTVISRTLPVVGGILSDSASILVSAAAVVQNSVGVFALFSICVFCVGPIALFSVKLFVYRGVSTAIGFLQGTRLPGLVREIGTVYGMLLALVGCNAAMLFLSIVSGIKAAVPT